jgi:hypothetical protein
MNTVCKAYSCVSSFLSLNLLFCFGTLLISLSPASAATTTIELEVGGELEFECSNLAGSSQAIWSFSATQPVTAYSLNISFSAVDPFPVNFTKPNDDPIFVDAGEPVRAVGGTFPQAFIWGTIRQSFFGIPVPTLIGSQSSPVPVNCTTDVR